MEKALRRSPSQKRTLSPPLVEARGSLAAWRCATTLTSRSRSASSVSAALARARRSHPLRRSLGRVAATRCPRSRSLVALHPGHLPAPGRRLAPLGWSMRRRRRPRPEAPGGPGAEEPADRVQSQAVLSVGQLGLLLLRGRQPAGVRRLLLPTGWRPFRGRPVWKQEGDRSLVPRRQHPAVVRSRGLAEDVVGRAAPGLRGQYLGRGLPR